MPPIFGLYLLISFRQYSEALFTSQSSSFSISSIAVHCTLVRSPLSNYGTYLKIVGYMWNLEVLHIVIFVTYLLIYGMVTVQVTLLRRTLASSF